MAVSAKRYCYAEIGELLGSPNGMDPSFPWSGVLDLFHSEVNTNSGLEMLLCHFLDQNGEFRNYLMEHEAFKQRRESVNMLKNWSRNALSSLLYSRSVSIS